MAKFERTNWNLREDGIELESGCSKEIIELFEMAMDGKIKDVARPTATAIMEELIEKVFEGGLLVGFTYLPLEMEAYFDDREEYLALYGDL